MDSNEQARFDKAVALGSEVVLIAEDDPVLRNLLMLVLQRESYAVLVGADGEEAIELSRCFRDDIQLLITNMEMPRMGGDELAELIMSERPGIRICKCLERLRSGSGAETSVLLFCKSRFSRGTL